MIVVAWWGNEARLLVETWRTRRTTIQRGLEITRVLLLKSTTHADFDRHCPQIRSYAIKAGIEWGREWLQAANDAGQVVLVFGGKTLNRGN